MPGHLWHLGEGRIAGTHDFTVIDVGSGVVTVALPGGGRIKARGAAALGQKVFVRDDAIEGTAPNLTLEIIEI